MGGWVGAIAGGHFPQIPWTQWDVLREDIISDSIYRALSSAASNPQIVRL